MLRRRHILAILLLGAAAGAAQETRDLSVLHTNDLHARLLPDTQDRGGFARLAAAIRREEQGCRWCLLVDAGDLVQGTPVSTLYRGLPVYEIARLLRFDVSTLGNHEFDYGWQRTTEFAAKANFPIVSANVVDGEGRLFMRNAYVIRQVNGLRVAVIGALLEALPRHEPAANLGPWRALPPVATLKKYATELRERADVVILLAHLDETEQSAVLHEVPQVNVIVGAHVHDGLPALDEFEHRVRVRNNGYGRELGRLDLKVDAPGRRLASWNWRRIPIDSSVRPASDVAARVAKWEKRVSKVVDKPIGEAKREYATQNLQTLVEGAMAEQMGGDFGLVNSGGLRDRLPQGRLLARHVWNIIPFDDKVVAGKFKGSELPQMVLTAHTVDPNREYTLVTTEFIVATGALGTKGLTFPQTGPMLRDLLIQWVQKKKVID